MGPCPSEHLTQDMLGGSRGMLTLLLPLQSLPPSDWQTPIASIQEPTSLGSAAQRLGFQFLQRVFTLYSEISSSPNTQGCQEEVNREASWWVLFLDAGVESIQPAFMLVPSRHFLPPSHRPNEQQTHQERFHNSSSAWYILKQWLQFPVPPRD